MVNKRDLVRVRSGEALLRVEKMQSICEVIGEEQQAEWRVSCGVFGNRGWCGSKGVSGFQGCSAGGTIEQDGKTWFLLSSTLYSSHTCFRKRGVYKSLNRTKPLSLLPG